MILIIRKESREVKKKVCLESGNKEAKEIAYTLENDIRERINVIVEGNTDLKYKVNQIMGSDVERELMKLRIHSLERTVMRMKERLEMV